MKIVNVFNDKGKTFQQIMEEFLVEFCLDLGFSKKSYQERL